MDEASFKSYNEVLRRVRPFVQQLRQTIASAESKKVERVWIRNQTDGELDERKIVDGLAGDKRIYKKRGKQVVTTALTAPKTILFGFDLSAR